MNCLELKMNESEKVEEDEFFADDALESDREVDEWNCTVGNRVTE